MPGLFNLVHSLGYKQWRATLVALMSVPSRSVMKYAPGGIDRRALAEHRGEHMAETDVISEAGGWTLQKR